jgi:hypothetical protein
LLRSEELIGKTIVNIEELSPCTLEERFIIQDDKDSVGGSLLINITMQESKKKKSSGVELNQLIHNGSEENIDEGVDPQD